MKKGIVAALLFGALILAGCRSRMEPEQIGFLSGDYAFVARDVQLHVVEIAHPDRPRWVATLDLPGRIMAVEVRGDYAYVAHDPSLDTWTGEPPDGGLLIIDISHPRRPVIVGFYRTPGLAQDVAVTDQVAYVADWDGIRVVDIRNKTGPVEITSLTDGMSAVAVNGQTLVGVWGNCSIRTGYCDGGLWAADITSPANPRELGTFHPNELPGYSVAFATSSSSAPSSPTRAFVAGKGMWQVDLSSPTALTPGPVYELSEGRYQARIATAGDHVFLVSDKGLRILDISNADSPVELAYLPMTAFVFDVAVRGDYLYTVSNEGLHIIDVRDPTQPQVVGYYSGVR